MDLKEERVELPPGANVIIGQSHFIKTVEDLYEALAESGTAIKFGLAFCEASGPRLVRTDGNDEALEAGAGKIAMQLACGHCFIVLVKNGFPVNVLNRIKALSEVCSVFAATANPLSVIIAQTEAGRGILGVIDGATPLRAENDSEKSERNELLKKIGYKR